jgi:hypothetical protein
VSLEVASTAFLEGYRLALEANEEVETLVLTLLDLESMSRPFAFEGGAMGCRLLDHRDGGRRVERLTSTVDVAWGPLVRARVLLSPPLSLRSTCTSLSVLANADIVILPLL